MRKERDNVNIYCLLPLDMYGKLALARDKKKTFVVDIIHLYMFETYKVGLNVQGIWNSSNAAIILVHGQVFVLQPDSTDFESIIYPRPGDVLGSFMG